MGAWHCMTCSGTDSGTDSGPRENKRTRQNLHLTLMVPGLSNVRGPSNVVRPAASPSPQQRPCPALAGLPSIQIRTQGEYLFTQQLPPLGPAIIADSAPTVDNSAEIWTICLTHAEKVDRALVESWKGDMDGILIFSGLFSAVISTFLANSCQALQPDPGTATAILTQQMVNLTANATHQNIPPPPLMPSENSYNAYLIINALWFLSLFFSLACALSATLVQQWSRIYLLGTEERFIPHERVRMRTYLQRGVQKFHLVDMVDAIPMLFMSPCSSSLAGSSSSFTSSPTKAHSPESYSQSSYPVSSYISFLRPYLSSTMTVPSRHRSLPFCHISRISLPTTAQDSAAAATGIQSTFTGIPRSIPRI
ncbi:hypothetical protein EI94DRAFT_474860 [Lactarius quietus]|nr:hypothetical protein EI94DRAFT_474860 [Lactarius quietus]